MAEDVMDQARLAALAAREIADKDICFVGIGVPSLAAMAAKRRHAPESVLIYESGAVDADPPVSPLSTGSPAVLENTSMATSCLGVFAMLQKGHFDLGLLSAAQVDRFGNLNSTVLGAPGRPPVRLVGSGGAHDIAVLAKAVVIMMPHDPRRFVPRVDFVTSPGLAPSGADGRRARGGGPRCLVTPRAKFTFETGEMALAGVAEGFDEKSAVEGFSWDVPLAPDFAPLPPLEAGLLDLAAAIAERSGRAQQ